jgi:serine/threonine protein phosphatase PrpC
MTLTLRCAGATHVGRRRNNEDALFSSARLVAVADGVGGAAGGEVASATVVNALALLDKSRLTARLQDEFSQAIVSGNEALRFVAECRPELAGMGTTLTTVALANDGRYLIANVGDSRTYLFRDRCLSQLTRDDSLVQALLQRGAISLEQARRHPGRSVVLEALDGRPRLTVSVRELAAAAGDRLLLCSDGLSDVVDERELAAALGQVSAEGAAEDLIALALQRGGQDNISVVVADVAACEDDTSGWLPALREAG